MKSLMNILLACPETPSTKTMLSLTSSTSHILFALTHIKKNLNDQLQKHYEKNQTLFPIDNEAPLRVSDHGSDLYLSSRKTKKNG